MVGIPKTEWWEEWGYGMEVSAWLSTFLWWMLLRIFRMSFYEIEIWEPWYELLYAILSTCIKWKDQSRFMITSSCILHIKIKGFNFSRNSSMSTEQYLFTMTSSQLHYINMALHNFVLHKKIKKNIIQHLGILEHFNYTNN